MLVCPNSQPARTISNFDSTSWVLALAELQADFVPWSLSTSVQKTCATIPSKGIQTTDQFVSLARLTLRASPWRPLPDIDLDTDSRPQTSHPERSRLFRTAAALNAVLQRCFAGGTRAVNAAIDLPVGFNAVPHDPAVAVRA